MSAVWQTIFCRYEDDAPGQVKVTKLDYLIEQSVGDVVGSRTGRVDLSNENRTYALPALQNVPEHVMTGWIQNALGAELVGALELDAMPIIDVVTVEADKGGFDPR